MKELWLEASPAFGWLYQRQLLQSVELAARESIRVISQSTGLGRCDLFIAVAVRRFW